MGRWSSAALAVSICGTGELPPYPGLSRLVPRLPDRYRACSPPSPPPPSARSTPAGCAAKLCCPAVPAATRKPAAARTAATSPARPGTSRTIPGSGSRCAATATTTRPPSCSTPTPGTCGGGSPSTCPATWRGYPGSPEGAALGAAHPLRQGRRIPGTRHRPFPRRHPPGRPGEDYQPPPARYTADLLCDAIRQATAAVRLTVSPGSAAPAVRLTFGAPQGTHARPDDCTSSPAVRLLPSRGLHRSPSRRTALPALAGSRSRRGRGHLRRVNRRGARPARRGHH